MEFNFIIEKEIIEEGKPKEYSEEIIIKDALKNLGELATTKDIQKYFKMSRSYVYKGIEERKLVTFKVGAKTLIMTRTVLNLFRNF